MLPISEFHYHRRVQFPETDATGIVHFTNFFKYVEEAEHAMWRAAGLSIAPPDSPIGWPRVAASFEFRQALRFEDEFDVHLQIAEKTRKTLRYQAVLRKEGETIAVGSLTDHLRAQSAGRGAQSRRHAVRHRRSIRSGRRLTPKGSGRRCLRRTVLLEVPEPLRGAARTGSAMSAELRLENVERRRSRYTPTVVCCATPRNGFTPLMPSQGYFSQGGSRSPSSRSRKPGTKNSFVSVVSFTRPVSP